MIGTFLNDNSGSGEYYKYYTIETGDTLYKISKKYNINPELLSALNGLDLSDYIYAGQVLMIPKGNYSYYLTKEGDSLNSVMEILKVSLDDLLSNNKTIYLSGGQLVAKKN